MYFFKFKKFKFNRRYKSRFSCKRNNNTKYIIYDNFIKTLFNYNTPKENNIIQKQFEFLFSEGLLKNRINTLNLKLQSFLFIIINDKFCSQGNNEQNKIIINDIKFLFKFKYI